MVLIADMFFHFWQPEWWVWVLIFIGECILFDAPIAAGSKSKMTGGYYEE
jgi:hypothetical protein